MVDDIAELCDRLREMPRALVERAVDDSEKSKPQREFWRMLEGPLHGERFDQEERLIEACRAMLADPGVFEHIARLKREIYELEARIEYLESQAIYRAEHPR